MVSSTALNTLAQSVKHLLNVFLILIIYVCSLGMKYVKEYTEIFFSKLENYLFVRPNHASSDDASEKEMSH